MLAFHKTVTKTNMNFSCGRQRALLQGCRALVAALQWIDVALRTDVH